MFAAFSKQDVSVCIDWVSFTLPHRSVMDVMEGETDNFVSVLLRHFGLDDDWRTTKGMHGYRQAAVAGQGTASAMVLWDGTQPGMGIHIQITGTGMKSVDARTLLALVKALDGTVRRLDLALDFTGVSAADDVWNALERGAVKTRAHQYMRIQSSGTTVYIGSRTSTKYLRVYDKGKQMNTGTVWTRIELEVKGLEANTMASVMVNEGLGCIPTIIRSFASIPDVGWYHFATNLGEPVAGVPKTTKATDTRKWILETCLPAIHRECMRDEVFQAELLNRLRDMFPGEIF